MENEKKRKVEDTGGWVFVGNLPPPTTYAFTQEMFCKWFCAQMRDRVRDEDHKKRQSMNASPIASNEFFIDAVEHFCPSEGYCFLKIIKSYETCIALRVSGTPYKAYQLSVTLAQCLPNPAFMGLSDGATPPSPSPYLDAWRGKYVAFSEMPPNTAEHDIRSLFEALGGPLETLWTYKVDGFFKGCGWVIFVNTLVCESVVSKLNGAPVGANVLRIAALLPERQKTNGLANIDTSRPCDPPVLSVSAQLFSDPVVALQLRSGRLMGERPSRVVQLLNIVRLEDLMCPQLHEELIEEVKREASKYGKLEAVIAPFPLRAQTPSSSTGCGKVFIEYSDLTAARKAQFELNGRLFDNRVVCASFYPLQAYKLRQYSLLVP